MTHHTRRPQPDIFYTPEPVIGWRIWAWRRRSFSGSDDEGTWGSAWAANTYRWKTPVVYDPHCSVVLRNNAVRKPPPGTEPCRTGAPRFNCVCGFHAWKLGDGEVDPPTTPVGPYLIARVELTGTVYEHQYGYRATRARAIGPVAVMEHDFAHHWTCWRVSMGDTWPTMKEAKKAGDPVGVVRTQMFPASVWLTKTPGTALPWQDLIRPWFPNPAACPDAQRRLG